MRQKSLARLQKKVDRIEDKRVDLIIKMSTIFGKIEHEMWNIFGAAKVFRKLIRISLDNYRIKVNLIKQKGQWRIRYAEWKYVTLNELFPESLSILKKLFPEL